MKKIMFFLIRLFICAAVAGSVYAQSAAQPATQPDVALINQLTGQVSWQSEGASAASARAFMKVRQGDRFSVPSGAQLRLLYLQSGRQETWNGPAAFRVGSAQSEPSNGQPAAVSTVPGAVPQRIAQLPELLRVAKLGRSGGVAVRAINVPRKLNESQQAEVEAARATYKTMRSQTTDDDITPELYLYSVLQSYSLTDEVRPVVEEMATRAPNIPEVQELVQLVRGKPQK